MNAKTQYRWVPANKKPTPTQADNLLLFFIQDKVIKTHTRVRSGSYENGNYYVDGGIAGDEEEVIFWTILRCPKIDTSMV